MAPLKRSYDGSGPAKRSRYVQPVRAMSKTGSDIADIKTRVASLSRQLAKVKSRRELKYKDAGSANQAIGYDVSEITDLSPIAQGPVSDERIGEEVSPTRIHIRGTLVAPSTFGGLATVRVLLIQMRDATTPTTLTTAGATQLVENQTTANAVLSHYVWDNTDKFTVLADRLYHINSGDTGDDNGLTFEIKRKVSRKIRFATATTTYESGGLYLCFIPNRVTADNIQMRFRSRLFFYDD